MKNRTNTRWLTQLALLVAVLLVMNYTPLGYLQVGPLSMSLLTIPVAIGAMTLGPVAGAILGGVFGTTSFVSALRTPSVMSAAMLQASPVGTFITCFVARVLVGLCAGWVYIGIKKLLPKNTKLCCAVGAVATPLLNTFWFMLSLCVFFFNTEYVQSLRNLRHHQPVPVRLRLCRRAGVDEDRWLRHCGNPLTVPLLKFLKK